MLETSVDLKIGQDQGMEHCRNKYNGYMAVINSKEEAVFLTSFLSGVTQSLTAPYAELAGFVGADWPDSTRYLEYQDGSFMTDGTYNDKSGFLFKSLYGAGEPRTCFQLGLNGNIGQKLLLFLSDIDMLLICTRIKIGVKETEN